ncbi:MAG: hypothetical protein ACK5YD_07915, partial [Phenylobacterium sp.]
LSTELRRNAPGGDLAALGEVGEMAARVLDWLRAAARGATPDRKPLDQASAWLARQQALYGDLVSPVSADRAVARTALADAEGRAAWLERTLKETQATVERLTPLNEDLQQRLAASQAAVREAASGLEALLAAG